MTSERSKFESMRMNPANWKLGIVYYCPDDLRVVVRQLLPVGWIWNFGHPRVVLAIALAIFVFLAPPAVAWWLGIRSLVVFCIIVGATFCATMIAASRLSRDPCL